MADYAFEGWVAYDKDSIGNLKFGKFEPKTWDEADVDIKIHACGICGTDLHRLRSGFGPSMYPLVVGHEITGEVVRVGSKVKSLRVGDRVGVGAQASSCLDCNLCDVGREPLCAEKKSTYNAQYADGSFATGGYATYTRVPSHFAFKLPDNLSYEVASTMFCAGVTVFKPLHEAKITRGSRVGVIGLGGLGHYAVLFAKAMGASVTVISRTRSKVADAEKLGASGFIATAEADWTTRNARSLDFILCTADSVDMPFTEYLSLLDIDGTFCMVGLPEGKVPVNFGPLLANDTSIKGSYIGSPKNIRDMLEFVAEHEIQPWIDVRQFRDINDVLLEMEQGKAHYRYVLKH